jgi:hypothetical protein
MRFENEPLWVRPAFAPSGLLKHKLRRARWFCTAWPLAQQPGDLRTDDRAQRFFSPVRSRSAGVAALRQAECDKTGLKKIKPYRGNQGPGLPALGPWPLALGPWHLALGTWHLALGTWHLALGTWHLALGTWHLALGPNDSTPSYRTVKHFAQRAQTLHAPGSVAPQAPFPQAQSTHAEKPSGGPPRVRRPQSVPVSRTATPGS